MIELAAKASGAYMRGNNVCTVTPCPPSRQPNSPSVKWARVARLAPSPARASYSISRSPGIGVAPTASMASTSSTLAQAAVVELVHGPASRIEIRGESVHQHLIVNRPPAVDQNRGARGTKGQGEERSHDPSARPIAECTDRSCAGCWPAWRLTPLLPRA